MNNNKKLVTIQKKNRDIHIKLRIMVIVAMTVLIISAIYFFVHSDREAMMPQHIFSIGMDVAAMAGVWALTIAYMFDKTPPNKSITLFFVLLCLTSIELYCYITGWIAEGNVKYSNINYISTTINYICSPVICIILWRYQKEFLGRTNISKKYEILLRVFCAVDVIFITSNFKFKQIFMIDSNGIFVNTKYSWITFIYPFIALISCMVVNIRSHMIFKKKIIFMAFALTPIVTAITTIWTFEYTYTYVVVFLVLIWMYGGLQLERSIELAKKDKELGEKHIEVMMSQIQPHFLYNTLNTISYLCEENPALAAEAVNKFSNYLRTNLNGINKEKLVPFNEELEHTKQYLWIEKLRFGDALNVIYDIGYEEFKIAPLTLQPLVENAVKHGVCAKEEGGNIIIKTELDEGILKIYVIDDGVGFDTSDKGNCGGKHIGIENVKRRLQLFCEGNLEIISEVGKGTEAIISVNNMK